MCVEETDKRARRVGRGGEGRGEHSGLRVGRKASPRLRWSGRPSTPKPSSYTCCFIYRLNHDSISKLFIISALLFNGVRNYFIRISRWHLFTALQSRSDPVSHLKFIKQVMIYLWSNAIFTCNQDICMIITCWWRRLINLITGSL